MVEKILNNTTPCGKIRASHEGSLHSSTLISLNGRLFGLFVGLTKNGVPFYNMKICYILCQNPYDSLVYNILLSTFDLMIIQIHIIETDN